MNAIVFVAIFACLAAANAGVAIAPGSTKIVQGPSTRTTVLGLDGSATSSIETGGSIVHEDPATVIAHDAPVVAAAPAAVTYSVPRFGLPYARTLYPYSAPHIFGRSLVPAYSAGLVAEKQLDTIVKGPSGTIATGKTVHRPALLATPPVYAARLHSYYL